MVSRRQLLPVASHRPKRQRSPRTPSQNRLAKIISNSPFTSPIVASPKNTLFLTDAERMHFEFFLLKTAPGSNTYVSSPFWSHIVPQACLQEPTIRHTILALSAWHRTFEYSDRDDSIFSIQHYDKALAHAHTLLKRAENRNPSDLNLVFIALLMFHCVQDVIGDYAAAQTSLITCRSLVRDIPHNSCSDMTADLRSTLQRFDIHTSTFTDISATYKYPEEFKSEMIFDPGNLQTIGNAFDVLVILLQDAFHCCNLVQSLIDGTRKVEHTPEQIVNFMDSMFFKLKIWGDGMDALEADAEARSTVPAGTIALMRIWQTYAMVCICKRSTQSETAWDFYQPQLVYMLSNIETFLEMGAMTLASPHLDDLPNRSDVSFSCELGVIGPLFHVASKSRDPKIRRKALSLLTQSQRREGKWDSFGAAAVAQRMMEIEEEGLSHVQTAVDVPAQKRIRRTIPRVHFASGQIECRFGIPEALTDGERWRIETVYFEQPNWV